MSVRPSRFFRVAPSCLIASAWLAVACEKEPAPVCEIGDDGICRCEDLLGEVDAVEECSSTTMGGPVVCCDDGTTCSCGLYLCNAESEPCFCPDVGAEQGTATTCTGTVCCVDESGLCSCDSLSCPSSSTQVESCTVETALCAPGEERVRKCVPREN